MTSANSISTCADGDEDCKQDVYERLRKLRHELAELRSYCRNDSSERVRELEDMCRSKEQEILTLKDHYQRSQEEIAMLRSMLRNNNDDIPPSTICACSKSLVKLEGLQALEKRALDAEKQAHVLNQELSKKVIEVNRLQLLCTEQAVRLMALSKERLEETQRLSRRTSERSLWSALHAALSSTTIDEQAVPRTASSSSWEHPRAESSLQCLDTQ